MKLRLSICVTVVFLFILLLCSTAFGYCPPGLIGYWSLDETGGSDYSDSSDNNLPASCSSSCPSPSAGRIEGSQQFSSDIITVPANTLFDWSSGDSFTIEAWMLRSGAVAGEEVLVGRAENGGDLQWWLGLDSSGNASAHIVAADGSGASADVSGSVDLTDSDWHHIVFIRDASTSRNKLYVDSVLVDSSAVFNYTDGFQSLTADVEIGALSGAMFFQGRIDEVAIYRRALSDAQIIQHYMDGTVGLRAGYCSPASDIRIMPLGDSITRGSQSTGTNGYRTQLFNDLDDFSSDGAVDYYIDFVGSLSNGTGTDNQHEGHSGEDAAFLTTNVATYLANTPADVVLLHIGTNDLDSLYSSSPTPAEVATAVSTATDEVENLLNEIWHSDNCPECTVVLARIILRQSSDSSDPDEYTHLLNDSLETMVNTKIAPDKKLLVVDHESALNYPDDMADAEHPNDAGYAKMADVWYTALCEFLPPSNEIAPTITSQPVIVVNLGETYSYDVEADGNPTVTFTLTTNPSGMTIDGATGLISWTPTGTGLEDVTVEVSNVLGSDQQTFQIDVNTPPVAVSDSYSLAEGATLNVTAPGVLDNDDDADGDTLTAELVSDVSNGTLSLNTNGSFTYTHDGSEVLSDGFTYRALDGNGQSPTTSVSFTVTSINDVPVITGHANLNIGVEVSLEILLTHLSVTDADNQYPDDFTLSVADGANYSRTGNTITPDTGFSGSLTVPVTVNDGIEDSAPFDVTVVVANATPQITGQGNISGVPGSPIDITLDDLTITDPDNDISDMTLTIYDGTNYTVSGNQITPDAGFSGTLVVPVSVNDGVNESDRFDLSVIVTSISNIPVITGHANLTIGEEVSLEILLAHLTVSDSDNQYPDDFTLSVADGANYSRTGNTITPDTDFAGNLTVPVVVNDGSIESDPFNVTVVVNAKPQITGQGNITGAQESTIEITLGNLVIVDPDNVPSDMTLTIYDNANYSLLGNQFTPDAGFSGTLVVPVSVNDGYNESERFDLSVSITNGSSSSSGGGGGGSSGCFISTIN